MGSLSVPLEENYAILSLLYRPKINPIKQECNNHEFQTYAEPLSITLFQHVQILLTFQGAMTLNVYVASFLIHFNPN